MLRDGIEDQVTSESTQARLLRDPRPWECPWPKVSLGPVVGIVTTDTGLRFIIFLAQSLHAI